MFEKLSLTVIFKEHFSSYKDDTLSHNTLWDYICFIASPIVFSVIIVFVFGFSLKYEAISSLLTIFAILIPLLFTSIVSIHDTMQNLVIRASQKKQYQTHFYNLVHKYKLLSSNVAFVIISAMIELSLLLVYFCKSVYIFNGISEILVFIIKSIYDSIVVSILAIILLHLFYIIKRLYLLFNIDPDIFAEETKENDGN